MTDLTRNDWQQMSDDNRRRYCEDLLPKLPDGFSFSDVVSYSLALQTNEVGLFEFEGAEFVFLPGGQFELGFDLSRCLRQMNGSMLAVHAPRRCSVGEITLLAIAIRGLYAVNRIGTYSFSQMHSGYTSRNIPLTGSLPPNQAGFGVAMEAGRNAVEEDSS